MGTRGKFGLCSQTLKKKKKKKEEKEEEERRRREQEGWGAGDGSVNRVLAKQA